MTQRWERTRKWLRRLAGGGLMLAFLVLLGGGFVYHRARAQLDESLFGLGAEMMRFDGAEQDMPRELVVNGQTIHFSSGHIDRPVNELLDLAEARCAEVDGGLVRQIAQLRREHPERTDAQHASSPVLRAQTNANGYVACLDLGPQSLSVQELVDRLERYNVSADIHDIGDARYVFAEAIDDHSTHFVAMWTVGPFDLDRMFPPQGDAPGRDTPDVPRPPRTRRMLSGFERGQPHTITVYWSRGTEHELESFYRRELPRAGWSLLEDRNHPLSSDAPRTLVAELDQRMITVIVHTDARTGTASAAVVSAQ